MTRVVVTGASGFVGGHTARALLAHGDDVVVIARHPDVAAMPAGEHVTWVTADITDEQALVRAFAGCDSVIHCAGINLQRGSQTYAKVHVRGTEAVVRAAQTAHVPRIALVSFLRARPSCGSAYHESKWAAEQIVRRSGLTYTILKAGVIYGRGDHLLDHLSRSITASLYSCWSASGPAARCARWPSRMSLAFSSRRCATSASTTSRCPS